MLRNCARLVKIVASTHISSEHLHISGARSFFRALQTTIQNDFSLSPGLQ